MPRVFISYTWESAEHQTWVKKLADRLLGDGIEAILDKYDLQLGDRLPQFMERSITGSDYVLIVCTPTYKQKADARVGGVGYEGHIISGELFSMGNERKFIPVLRSGSDTESIPTYLNGKLYVDLRDGASETGYDDLVATLFDTKRKPPVAAARPRSTSTNHPPFPSSAVHVAPLDDGPIKIIGIILNEVTEPRNDGAPGCALYRVPFRLSRRPSARWANLFVKTWDWPPSFSTMHRPGIASVVGDRIILDGTTIEEVRDTHRETLALCVNEANKLERDELEREQKEAERKHLQGHRHRENISNVARDISF